MGSVRGSSDAAESWHHHRHFNFVKVAAGGDSGGPLALARANPAVGQVGLLPGEGNFAT